MGVVYEATQASLSRRVALKVLPPHAVVSEQQRERFRREAQAAARLHHTNIVPVFGTGEEGGVHYYAMQFIHGQSLDEVIEDLQALRDEETGSAIKVLFPVLAGELVPHTNRHRKTLEDFRAAAKGDDAPSRLAYLEGRVAAGGARGKGSDSHQLWGRRVQDTGRSGLERGPIL